MRRRVSPWARFVVYGAPTTGKTTAMEWCLRACPSAVLVDSDKIMEPIIGRDGMRNFRRDAPPGLQDEVFDAIDSRRCDVLFTNLKDYLTVADLAYTRDRSALVSIMRTRVEAEGRVFDEADYGWLSDYEPEPHCKLLAADEFIGNDPVFRDSFIELEHRLGRQVQIPHDDHELIHRYENLVGSDISDAELEALKPSYAALARLYFGDNARTELIRLPRR